MLATDIVRWAQRVESARRKAHSVLSSHEASPSRVITLRESVRRSIDALPADVRDYFGEAFQCLEAGMHRAAVVTLWGGYMYVFRTALEEATGSREGDRTRHRKSGSDLDALSDSRLLEVAAKRRFVQPQEAKELQGYLAIRNRCAHFTRGRQVSLSSALGMADALLGWIVEHLSSTTDRPMSG